MAGTKVTKETNVVVNLTIVAVIDGTVGVVEEVAVSPGETLGTTIARTIVDIVHAAEAPDDFNQENATITRKMTGAMI